jgi:cell wall-associated NlpC family hydrolase
MKSEKASQRTAKIQACLLLILSIAASCCAVRSEPEKRPALRPQIAELAKSLVGIPYVFGGTDIDGFDCSGLVFYVYDCFGIRVPRNAREQGRMEAAIKLKHAAPGDILVFKLKRIWHSAIYLGDGRFVHAPNAAGWVRLEILSDYWLARLKVVLAVLGRTK